MANERIVSPSVTTNERDLSFLPQGIGEIGAIFVGPTVKGPAFVPTVVESFADYINKFGPLTQKSYLPYAVKSYLEEAGSATVVRVLGTSGYTMTSPIVIKSGSTIISVLSATNKTTATDDWFSKSSISSQLGMTTGSFVLTVSGTAQTTAKNFSASFDTTSADYISKHFGTTPDVGGTTSTGEAAYLYANFKIAQSASLAAGNYSSSNYTIVTAQDGNYTQDYTNGTTPWITSQKVGSVARQLFRFHTLSHGEAVNYELKVGIRDIKAAGTVPGSQYGEFTVVIRTVDQSLIPGSPHNFTTDDSDNRPNVVETFTNVNLDPDSPRYIKRVIGDKYYTVDTSDNSLTLNGDYPNQSKYIRVEVDTDVDKGSVDDDLVPFGFKALTDPFPTTFGTSPKATYVANQKINSTWNKKKFWGFDYGFATTDNLNYLKPLPQANSSTGSNTDFYLGDYNQDAGANFPTAATAYSGAIDLTTNTSQDSRKFLIPFQGGADGYAPNRVYNAGSDISAANMLGWDFSSTSAAGYTAFKKAIDIISDQDQFDFNILCMPGPDYNLHSNICTYAKDMVEDRGDAFYLMDLSHPTTLSVSAAVTAVNALDSNYVATYYPWVKILDSDINKPVSVPPSVIMPRVLAFTDNISGPWYAPAGFNRAQLTEVIEPIKRMKQADRDTLYDGRINPIVNFSGMNVVWGQKTLQAKPSALDRINVRRLLIAVKKYIASSTRYLVFEQNVAATRNRFLNIVNPYLDTIKQKQGLYAFKVQMDENNNTPDLIDRNIMYGQIWLQPTKTAEFIILDFNILPTGASFPE